MRPGTQKPRSLGPLAQSLRLLGPEELDSLTYLTTNKDPKTVAPKGRGSKGHQGRKAEGRPSASSA